MKIAIIIPAFKEAENVDALFAEIDRNVASLAGVDISFFVVDDRSPDGTADRIRSIAKKYRSLQIELLQPPARRGLGAAYRYAFEHVLKRGVFTHIGQMDADLSHDPRYLKDFIAAAKNGGRIIVSSRYCSKGQLSDWGWLRRPVTASKC